MDINTERLIKKVIERFIIITILVKNVGSEML